MAAHPADARRRPGRDVQAPVAASSPGEPQGRVWAFGAPVKNRLVSLLIRYAARFDGRAWHQVRVPGRVFAVSALSRRDMRAIGPTPRTAAEPLARQRLPDPYAANVAFEPRQLLEPTRLGILTMLLRWQPGAAPTIDLLLPTPAMQHTTRLPSQPALTSPSEGVARDADAGIFLLDVSTNVSLFGVSFFPSAHTRPSIAGAAAETSTAAIGISDLFL